MPPVYHFIIEKKYLVDLISLARRVLNECSFVAFLLSFEKSSYFFSLMTFKYSQTNKCRPICNQKLKMAPLQIPEFIKIDG